MDRKRLIDHLTRCIPTLAPAYGRKLRVLGGDRLGVVADRLLLALMPLRKISNRLESARKTMALSKKHRQGDVSDC